MNPFNRKKFIASAEAYLFGRLQKWLIGYVNSNLESGPESRARFPLVAGRVSVRELPGRPGVFGCTMHLQPHFQLDDVAATFRLVTDIAAPGVLT